jgi:hypothetical protein
LFAGARLLGWSRAPWELATPGSGLLSEPGDHWVVWATIATSAENKAERDNARKGNVEAEARQKAGI